MSNNDSQDYPVDYEDDYFSEMELENAEDQSSQQLDQEQDHQTSDWRDLANVAIADSHLPTPAPISSTTFSLDTRFRDRQSANQSAEAFAAAGGIVVAPSPTRLQPPSRRGHKLGGNSKPRKPKNSDSTLQPVAYPQSSLLDQGSNKETKAQQMHRLECNIVRLEAFINRRTEEIQTSTASAITSLREQMTHDIQVEMSRSEERSALNLAPHLQELKSLIHQELKVLEGQLKTLISSSIPLEAMNELLLTMETLLNHSPSSSASTTTSPLVLPSSPPASLINRITDSPLPRSAVKRQEPLAEDGEHRRKRLRSDPRFAHSATAILPSNAPALPAMVNPHIFDMYFRPRGLPVHLDSSPHGSAYFSPHRGLQGQRGVTFTTEGGRRLSRRGRKRDAGSPSTLRSDSKEAQRQAQSTDKGNSDLEQQWDSVRGQSHQ